MKFLMNFNKFSINESRDLITNPMFSSILNDEEFFPTQLTHKEPFLVGYVKDDIKEYDTDMEYVIEPISADKSNPVRVSNIFRVYTLDKNKIKSNIKEFKVSTKDDLLNGPVKFLNTLREKNKINN